MKLIIIIIFYFCTAALVFAQQDTTSMKRRPLETVFKEHQQEFMSIPGVQGFYEGMRESGEPCIVVMVDVLTDDITRTIPDSLEGYPVEIEVTGEIKPLPKSKKPSP